MKKSTPPPRRASVLAAPAETEPALGAGLAAGIYLALALVYFLPAFLPGRQIFGTDYLHGSFSFYAFVQERLRAGSLPGWVPYVYGGLPHFANPGGTYHPVMLLAELLLPTRLVLPTLLVFQFAVAGWGMYLLGRELGCRRWVAFVIGLAFQWTGILTSWVYAGHDGRIIVVSFAPLLFFFLHRGIRTARLAPFAGVAATVGFALLSFQIQNAWYLLVASAAWAVFLLVANRTYREPARLARVAAMGLGSVAFAFALASVNFLPFRDYVDKSPRGMTGGRGYEFSVSYSMPGRAVMGMAAPEQVGATIQNERGEYVFPIYRGENSFRLHTEYLGALVLVLVALGAYYARRDRYWWFFAGLGVWALTMALGKNTPLYHLYWSVLPGLKRFRAPDLAYYVLAFSLVCMAAVTLESLARLRDERGGRRIAAEGESTGPFLWIAGAVPVLAALLGGVLGASSAAMAEGTSGLTPAQGWVRFAFFAAATAGVLWAWYARKATATVAAVVLSLLTVTDLWVIGRKFFETTDGPEALYAQDEVTAFLTAQARPFRFFPVGESPWPRFKNLPMWYGLENAGGEQGNQLQTYNEFAGAGKETYVDFHNLLGDARFLAAANVRYLLIPGEVQAPFLREAVRSEQAGVIVYENTMVLPRAYLAERVRTVANGEGSLAAMTDTAWDPRTTAVVESARPVTLPAGPLQGAAQVTEHGPDHVAVRATASREALLVLSDNWYQDWMATVDGREVPILRANHTFRGVVVPAGTHTVEFRFRSDAQHTGFVIYLVCMALLAGYGAWLLVSARRRRPAGETTEA